MNTMKLNAFDIKIKEANIHPISYKCDWSQYGFLSLLPNQGEVCSMISAATRINTSTSPP